MLLHWLLERFFLFLLSAATPFIILFPKGRRQLSLQRMPQGVFGQDSFKDINTANIDQQHPLTWLHAASVGELLMALTFVDYLISSGKRKKNELLLTYSSVSAEKLALQASHERGITLLPLPLTFWSRTLHLIRSLKIELFIAVKLDLYPHIHFLLKQKKARRCLLGYHLATPRLSPFKRCMLKSFDTVSCVNEETQTYLQSYFTPTGTPELRTTSPVFSTDGDLKWESAARRAQAPDRIGGVCILGSLWPKDWHMLYRPLLESQEWKTLIIIPHEPCQSFRDKILNDLVTISEKFNLLEKLPTRDDLIPKAQRTVVLVFQTGVLMQLYRFAEFSFVGGGFEKRVHNVCEPISYGQPVITGPQVAHAPECSLLARLDCLKICPDEAALREALSTWLPKLNKHEAQKRALQWTSEQLHISAHLAQRVGL